MIRPYLMWSSFNLPLYNQVGTVQFVVPRRDRRSRPNSRDPFKSASNCKRAWRIGTYWSLPVPPWAAITQSAYQVRWDLSTVTLKHLNDRGPELAFDFSCYYCNAKYSLKYGFDSNDHHLNWIWQKRYRRTYKWNCNQNIATFCI